MGRGRRRASLLKATAPSVVASGRDLPWAERLLAVFANRRFWRLPKTEKEQVYTELAGAITEAVAAQHPAWDTSDNRAWWAAVLRARFGGNDFWTLSAAGKRTHCAQVAREIALGYDIVSGPELTRLADLELDPGLRERPSALAE